MRRASQLAGLGMIEAIRSTEAGCLRVPARRRRALRLPLNGARLDAYRSITASGTENINNMHYFRNTTPLEGRRPRADGLRAGLPLLRERHRPHVAGERHVRCRGSASCCSSSSIPQCGDDAHPAGRDAAADSRRGEAGDGAGLRAHEVLEADLRSGGADAAWRRGGGVFSHTVGHGRARRRQLSARPAQARAGLLGRSRSSGCRRRSLYLRYEDTVVVTETGVENFTDFLPSELDDLEALVRERGMVQAFPEDRR